MALWQRLALVCAFPGSLAARVSLACDGGIPGVPGEFFERFDFWQRHYARDSLERSREFLHGFYERKLLPQLDKALELCPLPVLELLMNSVLASFVDYSPADGEALYRMVMQLARGAPEASGAPRLLEEWRRDTAHVYPLLFGMHTRHCYGSTLKIFVYEVPENLVQPSLHCVNGQWGTEVLLHRFFLHAACRTMHPEEADFFYVPIYSTCLFVMESLENDKQANARLWGPLITFLNAQPWFERRGRMDHIFVFADGQSARVWDSYDLVRSEAVFMMVESKCPTWDEPMRRYSDVKSCSSPWKDIIIPGHTDNARAHIMRDHNKPTEERDILLTFHGRHPNSSGVYDLCNVRAEVVALDGLEGADVGGFVPDYLERKGRSHFCLVPGGTSPWTNHLYESFFSGCVPVILSDEYEVAFRPSIDWPSFSIKWPESAVGDLYDFLQSFPKAKLQEMRTEVQRHACWFDYYSEDPACSPYLAVLRALEERSQRLPSARASGRFWNAEPAVAQGARPSRTTRFHSTGDETFQLS